MPILNQVGTALTDIEAYHAGQDRPVVAGREPRRMPGVPVLPTFVDNSTRLQFGSNTHVTVRPNRDEDERNSDNAWIAGIALFVLSGLVAFFSAGLMREWEECGDIETFENLPAQMQSDPSTDYGFLPTHLQNAIAGHKRVVTNNYLWRRNVTILTVGALLGTGAAFTGFMLPAAALATAGTITAVAFGALAFGYIVFNAAYSNCYAKKPHYSLTKFERDALTDARTAYNDLASPSYSSTPQQVYFSQGYQPPAGNPYAEATAPPK